MSQRGSCSQQPLPHLAFQGLPETCLCPAATELLFPGCPQGVLLPSALPPLLCISIHPSKCSNTVKDPSETFHSRGIYII